MRISDWSSDVCSSDLKRRPAPISQAEFANARQALDERMTRLEEADEARALAIDLQTLQARVNGIETRLEKTRQVASASRPRAPVATKPKVPEPIGRASCRERVCQYV